MNEHFLSFVWKYRLYNSDLKTTNGEPVTVIKTGEQHTNAGPDFFNARVRIGDTLWAGNVEIHVKASDWYRHGHQADKAYNNVILHVVYEADSDIILGDMTTIPTIALSEQTDTEVLKKYSKLRSSPSHIPCGNNLKLIDSITLMGWLDRMLVERMEHKSILIEQVLHLNNNDWEEAFYQLLARNFGFHVNAVPFEMLARCLPRKLMLKHVEQPLQLESLLFGQAGFLEGDFADAYPQQLKKEYKFLSVKYGLIPLEPHIWKLLRMRPANFPTIRLSQFASLINSGKISFQIIQQIEDVKNLMEWLRVTSSPYWSNHYLFDKVSRYRESILGVSSIHNIIINTIAPMLFYFGKTRNDLRICEQAFNILRETPAEQNRITREWEKYEIKAENAYTGQALLGLYNDFCSKKKCLNCSLGTAILRQHVPFSG